MTDETVPADLADSVLVETVRCPRGTLLFRQGDADGAAYILKSGAIGLYRESQGRRVPIATVRPGEMFGELAVSDGSPRRATAVAVEDCAVLKIPADVLAAKRAAADPFLQSLLRIFADNLRRVHESYTPRTRSFLDSVNSLSRQYDVVAKFLRGNVPPQVRAGFESRLRALEVLVKDMRRLAMAHRQQDRRDDAVPHEADLPS
jgi:CRP-like cAMP-binding protein